MTDGEPPNKIRDTVLDFWRGISILFVIAHHLFYFKYGVFKNYYAFGVPEKFWEMVVWIVNAGLIEFSERSGPLGVKIFFVISGYIITKLLISEERVRGSISAKRFYIRRAFRILPPYLFYLTFVLISGMLGWIALDTSELLYASGFMCNLPLADCGWNITHTWSLATEEQFYLIWPILFLLIGERYRTYFLASSFVILTFLSAFEVFMVDAWLNNSLSFACIALGALHASSRAFRSFMERYGAILAGGIILLLISFWATSFINEFSRQIYRNSFPLLILSAIVTTYKAGWLIKTRFFLVISQIGLISYSLYLWQQVFLAPPNNYPTYSPLLYPILIIPFVLFSYFFIEKPAVSWVKNAIKPSGPIKVQREEEAAMSQTSP